MGVLDKFLNIMKLSDDDDDYENDDFFDEDDLEDYEEKPKRKLFGRDKTNEETENFSAEEEEDYESRQTSSQNSKVTPMRRSGRRPQATGMEVCVIKPSSVDDAREITETLLSGRTVILNLEGLDLEIAQRIIDFTSGSCFAISGNLQKISNYIFIITPAAVDISGDFLNIVDSFDTTRGL